jgi:hypothetical protein
MNRSWKRAFRHGAGPGRSGRASLITAGILCAAASLAAVAPSSPASDAPGSAGKAAAAPHAGVKRAGPTSGIGAYLGFPSLVGLMVTAPVDGVLAFRSGLTGIPGVGILWTPGLEIRFDQERGTYNRDGYYGYGNLFFGRIYQGSDRETTGFETGFGYRWFFADRGPKRSIVGFEAGGHWDADSAWPDRPSVRVFWMVTGR